MPDNRPAIRYAFHTGKFHFLKFGDIGTTKLTDQDYSTPRHAWLRRLVYSIELGFDYLRI